MSARVTLPQFFEQVYLPLRLLGRSAATVADMRSFGRLWESVVGPLPLAQVSLETAGTFVQRIAPGRSAATVNKLRGYLLAILREARRAHLIRGGWFRRIPILPEERKLPVAWTREQVEAILRVAAVWPGVIGGIPLCQFLPALLLVVVNTGVRVGAALAIRTEDVSLGEAGTAGTLIVRAQSQKTRKEQWYRLSARTVAALRLIHDPARPLLFSWPAHRNTLLRYLKNVCRSAGVPIGGHSGVFHRLRTTAITYMWFMRSPDHARALAGHSSIRTTAEHYVDPRLGVEFGSDAASLF